MAINTYTEIHYFDTTFYGGNDEKCCGNGKEYYLFEIREFVGDRCVKMYHKYILCNTIKSTTMFLQLLKEQQFVEYLAQQPKIIDMQKTITKYIIER